jgi:hypothetical protein
MSHDTGYAASEDYLNFLRQQRAQISILRYAGWQARVKMDFFWWRSLGVKKKRLVPSTRMQRRFPFILNARPAKLPWPSMFTLQWAHALLGPRYSLSDADPNLANEQHSSVTPASRIHSTASR